MSFFKNESDIKNSLRLIIEKQGFKLTILSDDELELKNKMVLITVTNILGDYSISFYNGRACKTLGGLIFEKYPDYIELIKQDVKYDLFSKTIKDFENNNEYILYLLKTSFEFIEENFPDVLKGNLW